MEAEKIANRMANVELFRWGYRAVVAGIVDDMVGATAKPQSEYQRL